MVVKRLELCHYQSMEQIVTQTEVIERNFKPPTTIAEHLRIVKEKENNARIYDDCKFCHALDEEQSYLFWFDCLNAAMRLYKIHKNILKKTELTHYMERTEMRRRSLEERFKLLSLPSKLQSERDFFELELSRTKKEFEISKNDFYQKSNNMTERIKQLETANQQLGLQIAELEVELGLTKDENVELTNQKGLLNEQLETRQALVEAKEESIRHLEEQVTTLTSTCDQMEENNNSNISRCRELQDQMARLIEQQNAMDPEMLALQQAMQGSDINQSRTSQSEVASINQLDCRICFESGNEKVCLPCGHLLCQSCSEQTINQRHQCPFCRNRVSRAEVYKIFDA